MFSSDNLEFNNLLEKYSGLTEPERQAYLIYKSNFFNLINDVSSIPHFMEIDDFLLEKVVDKKSIDKCRSLGKALNNSNNIFIKYTLFNGVDFNDNISLIRFAKQTYLLLEQALNKIKTDKNMKVYRIVSIDELDQLEDLSRSNFISTSIEAKQTFDFINSNSKKVVFYEINIEAGTPIVISPYSIVNEYDSLYDLINNTDNYSIKISKSEKKGQKEILLSKDSLDYSLELKKVDQIDGQQFYYYEVNTKVKNNEKNYF